MAANPQQNGQQPRLGIPGWPTAVMVLVAFIVGLIPYVATQGKWASKEDVRTLNDRVNVHAERLAAIDAEQIAQNEDRAIIKERLAVLEQQMDILLGVYGPNTAIPGPPAARGGG